MSTFVLAALLGLVEGLTEFIPVSSTGHLILLVDLLEFHGPPGRVFEIAIQLGAILAVCWIYRRRLLEMISGLPSERRARHFALIVLIGFLPAAAVGALTHGFIKTVLFSPWVVAVSLLLGGFAILAIERIIVADEAVSPALERISYGTAFKIGLFQTLAMIPGVSRSGATIMGARLLGVDRPTAAEFSFFLAIPTMFGATIFDLYKNRMSLEGSGILVITIGFAAAFIAGLLVVRTLVIFVSRHGFAPFAWYRIALGTAMLILLVAR
ncbi:MULTISPECIES: undecaprenyl-diphosphate phosphatase [Bosea]|uniref:Undecaprenyl-diphosphatase n=2 Tax=Bosea TaxID=85413 RepID=A0A927EB99_9HYPH|nr:MULTISPECIES: undecaprenyl-diphosphate phosphatase [Bosea]MBD3847312.1 undecaprenyl-diphosphate phosphatase [Bosea spartocytisi]MCP4559302.1 undecaprenyl-diphosphate phosphatase [Bosea sp. (in: a-proteobacteria)]MCP4733903.1 undecaprenyl-diphosphate phosphatase [Bosea sp. (in: a-proteobacteria)]MCT4475382.1 undecaprenyl-diphosphate phosphatase [Bosea spartocytisi]